MRYALGAMRVAVVLVFNSAIPGPCSAEQTSLGRNPKSLPTGRQAHSNTPTFLRMTPFHGEMDSDEDGISKFFTG